MCAVIPGRCGICVLLLSDLFVVIYMIGRIDCNIVVLLYSVHAFLRAYYKCSTLTHTVEYVEIVLVGRVMIALE